MLYELLKEADSQNVKVYEKPLLPGIKGLYGDNIIWLNQRISTCKEKTCVLAEEMGHHYTSFGCILDQKRIVNVKQEKRARNWAYKRLIPLKSFVKASKEGISNRYELAEFLGVTEEFLEHAIAHYKEKYGPYVKLASHVISFEPLGVLQVYD